MRREGSGAPLSANVELAHSMKLSGTAMVLRRDENPAMRASIHCCRPAPLSDSFIGSMPIIDSLTRGMLRDEAKPKL